MAALFIMLAFYLIALVTIAASLWLSAKLLHFPKSDFLRALGVAFLILAVGPALAGLRFLPPAAAIHPPWALLIAAQIALAWYMIKHTFRTSTGRAWAGYGFFLLSQALIVALGLLIVRPILVEAFSVNSLAMAPTLRGEHYTLTCPKCLGELLVDVPDPRLHGTQTDVAGICADCRQLTTVPVSQLAGEIAGPDLFFVTKFLTPHRWDIIAYRAKAGDTYIHRLVGLPGETIAIDDAGHISINGHPAGSPPDQPSQTFPWPESFDSFPHSLSPGDPLHLGPDDYFVIGDNSRRSNDSRFFGPIHRRDIVGVVSLIYWPPSRMRLIR